jgi:arylsulfatase A-like enzyme
VAEANGAKAGFPWAAAIAAATVACLARAALIAAKDGWVVAGRTRIGVASLARNTTSELAWVLGAALLFAALAWWGGRRPLAARGLAFLAALALAWLFAAVRLPHSAFHAPGFSGGRAWIAQALAAAAALAAALLLVLPLRPRVGRVLGAAAAAVLVAALGVRCLPHLREDARPSVILISLDTVRRDRLGCYGFDRGTTPEIDRFAQRSVLFRDVHSPEAWTLTAHMSLLTSLPPLAHGVDQNRPLPDAAATLAGTLRRAGYATAALVDDVGWLHPYFGFDRGFDAYRRIRGDARAKNAALEPLLDDLEAGGPFFLMLHYFDAHGDWGRMPYEAPPEELREFAGWYQGSFDGCDERDRCGAVLLRAWTEEKTPPPEEIRKYLSSLYDAGLAALDRELGRLFDDLERRGLLDRAIVVLTADHGEEFFEHGMALHRQLHGECTAVPLLVRSPGGTQARRVEGTAGLVDVAPTILELAGIGAPRTMQGRTLAAALRGDAVELDRPYAVLESGQTRSGLRTARYLLLRDGANERLFDLAADPGEREELLGQGAVPPEIEGLRAILDGEIARARGVFATLGDARAGQALSKEERDRLHGLGYVDGEK